MSDLKVMGQATLIPVEISPERLKELPPLSRELFCDKCQTVMLVPTILALLKLLDPQKLGIFICPKCFALYELITQEQAIVVPKGPM